MNNEAEYIYHEINRFVLLLRFEEDAEKRQKYLDEIMRLNEEHKRLYNSR